MNIVLGRQLRGGSQFDAVPIAAILATIEQLLRGHDVEVFSIQPEARLI